MARIIPIYFFGLVINSMIFLIYSIVYIIQDYGGINIDFKKGVKFILLSWLVYPLLFYSIYKIICYDNKNIFH
ncbi:hypothetical protein D7D81_09635 [Halocella sp. SP3-1]|nr:hypothetical protein D7D81_09635 [Halocella sp. SP3-1]